MDIFTTSLQAPKRFTCFQGVSRRLDRGFQCSQIYIKKKDQTGLWLGFQVSTPFFFFFHKNTMHDKNYLIPVQVIKICLPNVFFCLKTKNNIYQDIKYNYTLYISIPIFNIVCILFSPTTFFTLLFDKHIVFGFFFFCFFY